MDNCYVAKVVSISDLAQALCDGRLQWVYAERMEDTVLTWLDALLNGPIELARWDHGRAFGPDMELAWWRRGEKIEARALLSDGSAPESISWDAEPEAWHPFGEDRDILLLGERDPQAHADDHPLWSTARIPRYLNYPITEQAWRVALVGRAYQQNGAFVAWRLLKLRQVDHV